MYLENIFLYPIDAPFLLRYNQISYQALLACA